MRDAQLLEHLVGGERGVALTLDLRSRLVRVRVGNQG